MADNIANELIEALRAAREHVSFLDELGVETISIDPIDHAAVIAQTSPGRSIATVTRTANEVTPQPAPALPRREIATSAQANQSAGSLFGELSPAAGTLAKSSETLEQIWADIGDCSRCGLCEGRTQVVNTNGNRRARLMFVGEAPGADEDAQGKPFVGRAGQLLTKMIEAMGIKRDDVIIGNVNRCRPPGNRQPTLEEAAICRPFLFREIAVIQPQIIVVMGNTALRNLLEIREGISRVRGKFQDFRGIKVMPTFHPAYLLRDPSKKRETWEDLKMVRDYLENNPPNF